MTVVTVVEEGVKVLAARRRGRRSVRTHTNRDGRLRYYQGYRDWGVSYCCRRCHGQQHHHSSSSSSSSSSRLQCTNEECRILYGTFHGVPRPPPSFPFPLLRRHEVRFTHLQAALQLIWSSTYSTFSLLVIR